MAELKGRAEMEARKEFIRGTDKEAWRVANWSPTSLKGLKVEELEDRLQDITHQAEAIDDQAKMMTWYIFKKIRDEFPSDKLFGQYILDLSRINPTHALCVTSQQTRNKWVNAARWCEKMKIISLPEAGLSQTAVFLLASPAYQDISHAIYTEIKGKNVPVSDVQRYIAQARSITVEPENKENPVVYMDYEQEPTPLRVVPVERNIAQEAIQVDQETIIEPPPQDLAGKEYVQVGIFEHVAQPKTEAEYCVRRDLITRFSECDNSDWDDAMIQTIFEMIDASFFKTDLKLMALHKERQSIIANRLYKK
jgi:hypothetical protein